MNQLKLSIEVLNEPGKTELKFVLDGQIYSQRAFVAHLKSIVNLEPVAKKEIPMGYRLYADGSGDNKTRYGAWAYVVVDENEEIIHEESGNSSDTTTNRMELTAVKSGLSWLNSNSEEHFPKNIEIISDSQYVIYSITKDWKKTANKDIWTQLYNEHKVLKDANRNLKYKWVKGHSGNRWNEHVDRLAGIQLEIVRELHQ